MDLYIGYQRDYAICLCTKCLICLNQIIRAWDLKQDIMDSITTIYNGKKDDACRSQNMTTKGLCHIQIRKNIFREYILEKDFIEVVNLVDVFTNEDKDSNHFKIICNIII